MIPTEWSLPYSLNLFESPLCEKNDLRLVANAYHLRNNSSGDPLPNYNPHHLSIFNLGIHFPLDAIASPPPMHNPNDLFEHEGSEYTSSSIAGSYWPTTTSLSEAPATSTAQTFAGGGPNSIFSFDHPHVGNQNAPLSYSSYPPSMVPTGFTNPDQRAAPTDYASNNNNKVAIPRLAPPTTHRGRRRSVRACEPCRQRKIKCDGVRPTCGQCAYHNNRCVFEDVKRVRDQKMLELLSKRAERYESLLRDLEGDADAPTARRIRKALKVSIVLPV